MTVRKVRPKQVWKPPPAVDHNAMGAAADMYRRGPDGSPERQQPVATDVIMVRNDSGADKRRGDVLALTRAKLLSVVSREHPWISAEGLDAANRNYILCVLLDPLPAGKIGPAQIAGIAPAYVNVLATWHRRAFPSGGATVQSGLFGPMELMSAPTVTGEQLCHVKIGHADNRSVVAKVGRSGISAARRRKRCLTLGSGTVSLYGPTGTVGQHCLLTDAIGLAPYGHRVQREVRVHRKEQDRKAGARRRLAAAGVRPIVRREQLVQQRRVQQLGVVQQLGGIE